MISALEQVIVFLSTKSFSWEVIVVDDGSKDRTVDVVRDFASKQQKSIVLLTNSCNHGKGYVVKQGMLKFMGQYALFTDADLSTPIEEIEKLLHALEVEGYDIAIGSRALFSSEVIIKQSFIRRNMGKFFNVLVQSFVFKGIKDTQCGFKCFKRKVADKIFSQQKIDGFSFDAELLYLARKHKYKIKEIPVKWYNSPNSKVHIFRDSTRMFFDLIKIRILH